MPLDFDIISGLQTTGAALLQQDTRARLERMFGDTTPKGQLSVIMPQVPDSGSPGSPINLPQEQRTSLAISNWLQRIARQDHDFRTGAGTEPVIPATGTERYLDENYGFNPGRDNEDFYAQRQHWYSEIPKSIFLKFPGLILSKTGTGIGYLAGLMNPGAWSDNYIGHAADNAIIRVFEGLEDTIKNDWLPTYQEAADRDKGFFARAFTDLNFWTDDVADGAAFMASAFVPGLALSKIGVGTRIASGLSRLGLAAENGVLGNAGLAKVAAYMRNAHTLGSQIDKTLMTALNTASEAMWEAKGVRDEVMTTLQQTVNPSTGRNYTVEEAKAVAGVAARNTFLANAAVLAVSNLWETNMLYKALGKSAGTGLPVAPGKLGTPHQLTSPVTRWDKFWQSTPGAAIKGGLQGAATEGLYEENLQLAIQRLYNDSNLDTDLLSQLVGQTAAALTGNDTEAAMNIGIGGLMGAAGGGTGAGRGHRLEQKEQKALLNALDKTQGEWLSFGNILLRNPDNSLTLTPDNKPQLDTTKIAAVVQHWGEMASLQTLADNTDHAVLLNVAKGEQFSRWVKAHLNAGIGDQVDAKLDALLQLSDEALIQMGYDPLSNPDRVSEVARLKTYSRQLKDLHQSIENDIPPHIRSESRQQYLARTGYLYQLGARQLALQQQSTILQSELDGLKIRMHPEGAHSVEDELVDQLNYLQERIHSQQKLLENLDSYEQDGNMVSREEEQKELHQRQQQYDILSKSNQSLITTLKKEKGRYVYNNLDQNRKLANQAYQKKIAEKAQIDNAAASINQEFYKAADLKNGHTYFSDKLKATQTAATPATPPEDPPVNPATDTPTGKKLTVQMKNNTPGVPDMEVELEEGRVYLGPLSKSMIGLKLGMTATLFQNDNIRIIRINPDNSVVMTVNNDAPVTFSSAELSQFPALKKYVDLSPLQKFYIQHRNTLIRYRIPVKYNRQTGKWETRIVNARLSYNKQDDILEIVYDKNKRIPFDRKYVVGDFVDLRTLATDVAQGLTDQQAKLDKLYQLQVRLFEKLIQDTEKTISTEKQRAADNDQRIIKLQSEMETLQKKLQQTQAELNASDQSRIKDNRTRAARLQKLIHSLETQITESQLLLASLQEEKAAIEQRQAALAHMQDQYYTFYGEILESQAPVTRATLTALESMEADLRAAEGGKARLTTERLQQLLEDSQVELDAVDSKITRLQDYIIILKDILRRFQDEISILQAFTDYPTVPALRSYLRDQVSKATDPTARAALQQLASRMHKSAKNFEDARFLLDELKIAREDLARQQTAFQALEEKISRLTDALQTRAQLEDTTQRIQHLKDVFAGLATAFTKEKAAAAYAESKKGTQTLVKAKTVEDAVAMKEQAMLFSEFIVEPPADQLEEERVIFGDSARPVMTADNNPLFKSADNHFPGDKLSEQPYTRRFFKFTSRMALDNSYYIMPVTADNDNQYGAPIRYTADLKTYPDDIKFVVVKRLQDGTFRPIGMDGQILKEAHYNNIIYSSFYGHADLLSGDKVQAITWARKTFGVRDNITDEHIWKKIQDYIRFREDIKTQVKEKGAVFLPITSKANGIQHREPKDAQGRPQQLPVEGRLTAQDPDWNKVDLVVSTTNGEIPGATYVKLKPGRLAIRRNRSVIQVYNRQLTEPEKARITRLLLRLTDLLGKKREYEKANAAGILTAAEQQTYATQLNHLQLITQYLSTILYWHRPKNGVAPHANQFYIDKGYLYKGNQSIAFTRKELETKLPALLSGVYHQVANILLTENYKNAPYYELDVDQEGQLQTIRTWSTYKEYLLSSKGRDDAEIPVYTNIVADKPDDDALPQLKNVYLSFSPGSENKVAVASASSPEPVLPINAALPQVLTTGPYLLRFHNSKGTIAIDAQLQYDGKRFTVTRLTPVKGESKDPADLINGFIEFFNDLQNAVFEDPDTEQVVTGLRILEKYMAKGTQLELSKISPVPGPSNLPLPATTQPTDISSPTPQITTPATPAPPASDLDIPSVDDILDNIQDDTQENFRLPILELGDDYIREKEAAVREWFKTNLPQVELRFVDYLLEGKAWGSFKKGIVSIYREAQEGTGFHEAFEAVWRSLLSPSQQQGLLAEFRRRPDYYGQLSEVRQRYPGLSEDELIKEQLAEEFRQFVLAGGSPANNISGQGRRNGFFRRLWQFITQFFRLPAARQLTVDRLFQQINQGSFAATPLRATSDISASFRKIPGITQEITAYAIEGITSLFFQKLIMKNQNMESLFIKGSNAALINECWKEVHDQVHAQWNTEMMSAAAYQLGYLTKEEAVQLSVARTRLAALDAPAKAAIQAKLAQYVQENVRAYRDKLTILKHFNTSVFSIFADYLKQYGFILKKDQAADFDTEETTEIEEKENSVKDPLGIRDSLTIDTRNTAATTVKLLIASLTDDEYSAGSVTQYKKNFLGLPKLVDYDKTLSLLFNELQGVTSVYRNGRFQNAIDAMFEKLDQRYQQDGLYKPGFVWIDKLKRRLRYTDKNNVRIPQAALTKEDIRLRIAFIKSFSKNKNLPIKMIVGENGQLYQLDPISTSNYYRIRERWANNAKAIFQSDNDFLLLRDNEIHFNKDSERFKALLSSNSLEDRINLLKTIGITFSIPDQELITGKYAERAGDAISSIRLNIENGNIASFEDLFSKQIVNGPINTLLAIELENTADDLSLQYRNPEGQTEYAIVPPSSLSTIINSLKAVDNLADFVKTHPQYGVVQPDGTVTLHTYQQNSQLLKYGGLLFDEKGHKRKDISYHLISGIALATESDGEITSALKRPDKVMQELYHLLNGIYYTVINADKSSEFAMELGHFVSVFDVTASTKPIPSKVVDLYQQHLLDEVRTLVELSQGIGDHIQYYADNQYDKLTGTWQLSHFRDIITGERAISRLQKAIQENTPENFVYHPDTQAAIERYLLDYIRRQQEALLDIGIIEKLPDGYYRSAALSTEQLSRYMGQGLDLDPAHFNQVQFDNLAKFLFINHQISTREQHKLFYGHPALYKDLAKRSSGITAMKESIVDDSEILEWMDTNMERMDGKLRSASRNQTFQVVSYGDVMVSSLFYKDIAEGLYAAVLKDLRDPAKAAKKVGATFKEDGSLKALIFDKKGQPTGDIAAYLRLTEADAQGYIMPDFYRDLLFLSGKFTDLQNDQWEYEMAYERQARSLKPPGHPAYRPYTSPEIAAGLPARDQQILANGNPHAVLPILKPQYFGYQLTPNLQHTVFLKHSVQPKFYRFFEHTAFEHIYIQAQQNQVDIIGYESGEKVGNIYNEKGNFTSLYEAGGTLNKSSLPPIQKLLTRFYGIQVEMAAKIKDEVIRGTQMTKLVMSNIFLEGHPVRPEYAALIQAYNKNLEQMTRLGKAQLLDELGLERTPDGNYLTRDIRKLVTTLRDEALKRDLPSNIIEAFEATLSVEASGLVYKFDAFSNREKIDNILNAIVDNRVISQRMHGKAAVQAAVTLYEPLGHTRKILYLDEHGIYQETTDYHALTPAQQQTARIASSELKFYRRENGQIAGMEVLLPHWFKEYFGEDVDIRELDPRLLRAIGFRIPTQGMNSIDNLVIKGFLRPEEGDTVVVPSELVGKAGSDFDIDKLNVYLPNYYIAGRDYGSEEFKAFMLQDLVARGLSKPDAAKILQFYTKADFEKINQATYTLKGKMEKQAALSLKEITDGDTYDQVAFVKRSITHYNSISKDKGTIQYVEPGHLTMPSLQNRLIELTSQILSLPENYRQLVTPNSSATLKGLEQEINRLKGIDKETGIPFTRLSEWDFMNLTREQFLVSKQLVGIGAVNVTSHALAQVAGIQLTGVLDGKPINIRFRHNRDATGNLHLGAITDQTGSQISELISEAMTGFVDAAKDPFVFTLNINPATAGTYFYMMRLGVPIRDIVFFHSQPIISEYLKRQQVNESLLNKVNGSEVSKRYVVAITMSNFIDKAYPDLVKDHSGQPSTLKILALNAQNDRYEYDPIMGSYVYPNRMLFFQTLDNLSRRISQHKSTIRSYQESGMKKAILDFYGQSVGSTVTGLTVEQAKDQLAILADFLDYQQQATAMTAFINGISYDTGKTKNIVENRIQGYNYQKILSDGFIRNPERILEHTFIGEMKRQREDIPRMFANYFVSLHPNSLSIFDKIDEFVNRPSLNMRDDTKREFLNRFQNFFLTYLLHTTPSIHPDTGEQTVIHDAYPLLFGQQSFATQLARLQRDPRFRQNKLLQELFPIIATNRAHTDNVKLFVNRMSTYEINTIIESTVNLLEIADTDPALRDFLHHLVTFAIIQSGLQLSPITYTKVLPNELYAKVVGHIFDRFTAASPSQIDPGLVYRQFFQNNWNNQLLVPHAKAGTIDKDGLLSIPTTYQVSNYDYVVKLLEKTDPETGRPYTKAQKEALLKQKKFQAVYDKRLFARFAANPSRVYYRPVNKLGNTIYATEAYRTDTSAMNTEQIVLSRINGYVPESNYEAAIRSIHHSLGQSSPADGAVDNDAKDFIDNNTCNT